jgi:hypothetical protein
MGVHSGQGREVLFQEVISTNHKILLLVAVDVDVGNLQVAIHWRREILIHREDFECIKDRHGIEYSLEVVIAIGPTFYDIESEVDFTDRLCYHIL